MCVAKAISHNVQRLPTYRSEEASEQRELAPERRYVQPAHMFSLDPPGSPAGKPRSGAAAIV